MMMMQHHSDGRAKSPRRVSEPGRRSLSPSSEELRHHQLHHQHHQLSSMYASSLAGVPLTGGGPRSLPSGVSRSATATPTGSPKRRHLPQIPSALQQTSFARVRQDVEERARLLKMRMGQSPSVGGGGGSGGGSGVRSWRMYSGHSDNDLPPQRSSSTSGGGGGSTWSHHSQNQQQIYSGASRSGAGSIGRAGRSLSGAASDGGGKSLHSPDRERVNAAGGGGGDSDVESLVSFVSGTSALSTQSERPAASYVKRVG